MWQGERAAGSEMRKDAISIVAEHRERVHKVNSKSKEHLRGKKMRGNQLRILLSTKLTHDTKLHSNGNSAGPRGQSDFRAQRVAEMNSSVQALINPNISSATKVRIELLLPATVTDEIDKMQAADAASPSAATSGLISRSFPPSYFNSPVKLPLLNKTLHFPAVLLQLPEVTRSKTYEFKRSAS